MNDCVWGFIFCEGNCGDCQKYISANSNNGEMMLKKYDAEVEEALEPLINKYKDEFKNM